MDPEALHNAPLGRLLHLAGRAAAHRWSTYLATHHGLTPSGMMTLLSLARAGSLTHRELAQHCMVRPATLTGVIDTLEKAGYVERRREPTDRRAVRLTLTPGGAEHARTIMELAHQNRPLTAVDADPANAAVIREFLVAVIQSAEDSNAEHTDGTEDSR